MRVVVYVGSLDGTLFAFDAAGVTSCGGIPRTCAPLLHRIVGSPFVYIPSSPAVANGVVYVIANDGKLHAFGLAPV